MAAGDLLADFSPQCNEPPVGNAATPHTRNGHPVLDFDDSADEAAIFTGLMPWHYGGGGITVHAIVSFTSDTNNAHTVQLEISFERIGDGAQDLDFDGFGLPDFRPVTCTVEALAMLIRWQCFQLNGEINAEALQEIAVCGRRRFTLLSVTEQAA